MRTLLILAALGLSGCNTVASLAPDGANDRAITASIAAQPSRPPICEGGDGQPPR